MLPLRELQDRLRALIADPATLTDPLPLVEQRVAGLSIHGDERLSPAERVRIYAHMHAVRLRDALAHDYPALLGALGDDGFDQLARRYVAAHPSDRPSLRDLGRHLPGYLRRHPDGAPPWHAELAQLEWAMIDAFDAIDEPVLERATLASLAPDDWPALRIAPVRSLQLLPLTHAVDTAREQLLAAQPLTDVPAETVLLRLWRQELVVYVRRVPSHEMAALRWLYRGATFAELCEWLDGRTADDGDPTATAASLLQRWIEDGLLVAS